MHLVIQTTNKPLEKKYWHSPNYQDRQHWSEIVELISNWFCYSNGIRKENQLTLILENCSIHMDGMELRYLAPSYRSVISLIYHAYSKYFAGKKPQPGISVLNHTDNDFPEPLYSINLSSDYSTEVTEFDVDGALFISTMDNFSIKNTLNLIGNSFSQALIWFLYTDKIHRGKI